MKRTILTIIAAMACAIGYSQTVDLPPGVGLMDEKFAVTTAAVTEGEKARASVGFDYDISKLVYLRGEIQSGADNVSIDNVGAGLGIYHNISGFRIFGGAIIRYNWTQSEAQGLLGGGVAYQPTENGVLAPWSVYTEARLLTPFNNKIKSEPPHREFLAGIRRSF